MTNPFSLSESLIARWALVALLCFALLAACGGVPRPLSKDDQRLFRFTENTVVQSPLLHKRDLAGAVSDELEDRWRYWLHGQRPMSLLIELHPDSQTLGGRVTQASNSDSFLARIILRDIRTDEVLADFIHRVTLSARLSSSLPSDQNVIDRWLAQQFANDLFAMFYYGELDSNR